MVALAAVIGADEFPWQTDKADALVSLIDEMLHPIADTFGPIQVNVGKVPILLRSAKGHEKKLFFHELGDALVLVLGAGEDHAVHPLAADRPLVG